MTLKQSEITDGVQISYAIQSINNPRVSFASEQNKCKNLQERQTFLVDVRPYETGPRNRTLFETRPKQTEPESVKLVSCLYTNISSIPQRTQRLPTKGKNERKNVEYSVEKNDRRDGLDTT